jgi:hypothetical protein
LYNRDDTGIDYEKPNAFSSRHTTNNRKYLAHSVQEDELGLVFVVLGSELFEKERHRVDMLAGHRFFQHHPSHDVRTCRWIAFL